MVGFAQKMDSLVKMSPKLPTGLEFREHNLTEKLSLTPVKTFPRNENIRFCCCNNGPPPLFILDGKEITNFEGINPKSIESIIALKDKSSIDIYGEKAKNGVVIITSKKK